MTYDDWLLRWTESRIERHNALEWNAQRSPSVTGVVIMRIGLVTGCIGVVLQKLGMDVRFQPTARDWPPMVRLMQRSGARPIDIESESHLHDGRVAFVEARDLGIAAAVRLEQRELCLRLASNFVAPHQFADGLGAAFALKVASGSDEIGVIKLWNRSRLYHRLIVFTNTRWQRAMLGESNEYLVTALPAQIDRALIWLAKFALGAIPVRRARSDSDQFTNPVRCTDKASISPAEVLFLPHQGATYGNLYRWDHLFSPDPGSPLHQSKIASLSYSGAAHDPAFACSTSLKRAPGRSVAFHFSKFFARNVFRLRSFEDLTALVSLSLLCAKVRVVSRDICQRFPKATIAILAYEMLVPPQVSLALGASGIRTVATQERPGAALQISVPKIVNTLLTASDEFSKAIKNSIVASVAHAPPNGMWRTDLLHEARPTTSCQTGEDLGRMAGKTVVVLPFHAELTKERSMGSPLLSWSACMSFLSNVKNLAIQYPDCIFIVRGKDDHWCDLPTFSELLAETRLLPNLVIDHDYSEFNRSYRLCASADLVIARHTSLAEECLALDIPTIFHDFTHNMSSTLGPLFSYLPDELWARDQDELFKRVAMALEADGRFFREWWIPVREELYGNWNDGNVRLRARNCILEMMETSQRRE